MHTTASIGEYIIRNMSLPYLNALVLSGQRFPKVEINNINYTVYNMYGNTECGGATVA